MFVFPAYSGNKGSAEKKQEEKRKRKNIRKLLYIIRQNVVLPQNGRYAAFAETSENVPDVLNEQIKNCYGSVPLIKNRSVGVLLKRLFTKVIDKRLKKLRGDGEVPGTCEEQRLSQT